jgi:hypothetical protein
MQKTQMRLSAVKSRGYYDSLCRHFARKVPVDRAGNRATVLFPMGTCDMVLDGDEMHFLCSAKDDKALDAVKTVIEQHVVRFGELKQVRVEWNDG